MKVALSGHHKFFLGTDSAPHLKGEKECAHGCAGVYSTPVSIPVLLEFFEEQGALDNLNKFCSQNGARFYQLKETEEELTFVKEDWTVPQLYSGVVPLFAGKRLKWQLSDN